MVYLGFIVENYGTWYGDNNYGTNIKSKFDRKKIISIFCSKMFNSSSQKLEIGKTLNTILQSTVIIGKFPVLLSTKKFPKIFTKKKLADVLYYIFYVSPNFLKDIS